jgi:hypothetical protein
MFFADARFIPHFSCHCINCFSIIVYQSRRLCADQLPRNPYGRDAAADASALPAAAAAAASAVSAGCHFYRVCHSARRFFLVVLRRRIPAGRRLPTAGGRSADASACARHDCRRLCVRCRLFGRVVQSAVVQSAAFAGNAVSGCRLCAAVRVLRVVVIFGGTRGHGCRSGRAGSGRAGLCFAQRMCFILNIDCVVPCHHHDYRDILLTHFN